MHKEWFFAAREGMTIREIIGPLREDCSDLSADEEHEFRTPYWQIVCMLPKPHHGRSNDSFFNVCEISGRPWQMRRNGLALELIEAAPVDPQGSLFA